MTAPGLPPSAATTAAVPRLWPDSTIVCLGSGPSLTLDDVQYVYTRRNRADGAVKILAVNDACRLAPAADVLFASDARWWAWHRDVPDDHLPSRRYSLEPVAPDVRANVQRLRRGGHAGLACDPAQLHGNCSGHYAINLAVHLGAATIILLGYDMRPAADGRHHFFGEHPDHTHPTYAIRVHDFVQVAAELTKLNILCLNASRETEIYAFVRRPLHAIM